MLEDLCRDHLMELDWEEGFICSLPMGHDGPHRVEGEPIGEYNTGTDTEGRKYQWVHEWVYD